jgi:hypothetical protein
MIKKNLCCPHFIWHILPVIIASVKLENYFFDVERPKQSHYAPAMKWPGAYSVTLRHSVILSFRHSVIP